MRRPPPGHYVEVATVGERFRAFVPAPLPRRWGGLGGTTEMLVGTPGWARLPEDFHSNTQKACVVIQEADQRTLGWRGGRACVSSPVLGSHPYS